MSIYILFSLVLSYILFSISKEDIDTMLISEYKLRIFTLFGLLYLVSLGLSSKIINSATLIINNFIAMLIVFIAMSSVSYISYKLFQINSLGFGDIKLSSISTIWLGIEWTFISLSISFLLSALYSIYGKTTKRFKPYHQYPFAPFLSIGIFCSWLLDKI